MFQYLQEVDENAVMEKPLMYSHFAQGEFPKFNPYIL